LTIVISEFRIRQSFDFKIITNDRLSCFMSNTINNSILTFDCLKIIHNKSYLLGWVKRLCEQKYFQTFKKIIALFVLKLRRSIQLILKFKTMKKHIITAVFSLFSIISIAAQSKKDVQVTKLYQNYIAIKSALASDDADKTSKAATEFIKTASAIDVKQVSEGNLNILRKDATAISEARTINTQRETFMNLSDNMIALAKEFKVSENPVYVQYCPMADGSWLSDEAKIVNPYYGKSMLSCGNVKSTIK